MLYGTPIRLPGEFLSPSSSTIDPATFVGKLRETMQELLPLTLRQQAHRAVFVSKDLSTCSHVVLRTDTINKSVVNIDRLKPAYISKEEKNSPSKTDQVLKESSQEYTTATPPATKIIPTKKCKYAKFDISGINSSTELDNKQCYDSSDCFTSADDYKDKYASITITDSQCKVCEGHKSYKLLKRWAISFWERNPNYENFTSNIVWAEIIDELKERYIDNPGPWKVVERVNGEHIPLNDIIESKDTDKLKLKEILEKLT
ncbi:reverse transcriptase [Caerostris darwini]|uniref:Reverse transcriptase n=1 Tax=Caerostris darwini TaxID=1538125 RepID=A0AAV4WKF5_9ARAC|nr:reverse transcriptase [Caerostris darwini]